MSLDIIGAGFGRTGTDSLREALTMLATVHGVGKKKIEAWMEAIPPPKSET